MMPSQIESNTLMAWKSVAQSLRPSELNSVRSCKSSLLIGRAAGDAFHLLLEAREHESERFQHHRGRVESIGWSHSNKGDPKMNLFDRSDPCAPIHMVMTPLGSAVAFLSLISVFEMVVAGVRWPDARSRALGHGDTQAAFHQTCDQISFRSEHVFAIEMKPDRDNPSSEIGSCMKAHF